MYQTDGGRKVAVFLRFSFLYRQDAKSENIIPKKGIVYVGTGAFYYAISSGVITAEAPEAPEGWDEAWDKEFHGRVEWGSK